MFHHVGHLTLDATPEQVEAIGTGLLGLPGRVPGLLAAEVAPDAGLGEGNATLRFHLRFTDEAAWRAYGTHPAHVAVVGELVKPVLVAKVFVQYDEAQVRRSEA